MTKQARDTARIPDSPDMQRYDLSGPDKIRIPSAAHETVQVVRYSH